MHNYIIAVTRSVVKIIDYVIFLSLHEQLRHLLKGVAQERSDITRDALKSLHSLLKSNKVCLGVFMTIKLDSPLQVELQKYMVGSDTVNPIITEIITTVSSKFAATSNIM